jgi:hypothetical protein
VVVLRIAAIYGRDPTDAARAPRSWWFKVDIRR